MRNFIVKHPAALIFGALIVINIMFAIGNIILLYQTSQKNAAADATLESAELRFAEAKEFNDQATFTATSGKLSQYQEEYQPHLVRWTESNGDKILFCSTGISVKGPYDDSKAHYWWAVNSPKKDIGIESFDMPSYAEVGDATYYHFSYRKNALGHDLVPYLESYRHIKVDTQIYEIECSYQAIPSDINPDDAAAVNDYIKEEIDNTLEIDYIKYSQPALDESPLHEVAYNDANVYPYEEEELSPCGCLNCCCDVCACAEK